MKKKIIGLSFFMMFGQNIIAEQPKSFDLGALVSRGTSAYGDFKNLQTTINKGFVLSGQNKGPLPTEIANQFKIAADTSKTAQERAEAAIDALNLASMGLTQMMNFIDKAALVAALVPNYGPQFLGKIKSPMDKSRSLIGDMNKYTAALTTYKNVFFPKTALPEVTLPAPKTEEQQEELIFE